jgi:hypothetical protein
MVGTAAEDDAAATTEQVVRTGEPAAGAPVARPRRWDAETEPPADVRAAARRAARLQFRRYCLTCGRSTEGPGSEDRKARCPTCGGTMLVEPIAE